MKKNYDEVEKSKEKIKILTGEISKLEKQYKKLVEIFTGREKELEKAKHDEILAQDRLGRQGFDIFGQVEASAEVVNIG